MAKIKTHLQVSGMAIPINSFGWTLSMNNVAYKNHMYVLGIPSCKLFDSIKKYKFNFGWSCCCL